MPDGIDMSQYGMYIGIGVFVLLALIVVPLVLRSTRKARAGANNFFPDLARRTGLQVTNDGLRGNYKGYTVHLQYSMSGNVMSAINLISSGNSNAYGKNAMYPRLHVTLNASANFSPVTLYETPGLLSHTSQRIQDFVTGSGPDMPKQNIPGSQLKTGIDIYTNDPTAGGKVASSQELAQLLRNWRYTEIKIYGNTVWLALDNNSAPSTIGIQKMYTPEFAIQALDITVAAANAAK
ncbi:MAG: hypothetical protein HY064_05890 [Bacteroidetes bacterium]|nr:hypothetical protein [Bacteroidota bacterium]